MAVKSRFENRSLEPETTVHESGQLSIWLQRGYLELGLPAICIDARRAHKSLPTRLNKSDVSDAEGLAQLARTGWFTPVFVRSVETDRLRALVSFAATWLLSGNSALGPSHQKSTVLPCVLPYVLP